MELSYKSAINFGWEKTKEQWRLMLAYGGLLFLFQILTNLVLGQLDVVGSLLSMVLSFFISFISATFSLFVADKAGDGAIGDELRAYFEYVKAKLPVFTKFIGMQLLMGVLMLLAVLVLGLIAGSPLLIGRLITGEVGGVFVPITVVLALVGLFLAMVISMRLQWAAYLLIEEEGGVVEMLKRSWEITKGKTPWLLGWIVVSLGLVLLGLLALIVGLIPAAATLMMANIYIYHTFANNGGSSHHHQAPSQMPPQPTRRVVEPSATMPGQEMV